MKADKNTVLITRPEAQAKDIAAAFDVLGVRVMVESMLAIQSVDVVLTDLDDIRHLVFTSTHAVARFAELTDKRDFSVFCVGDKTASTARDIGFSDVKSAGGNAEDLEELIKSSTASSQPILYLQGQDTAYPLSQNLRTARYDVHDLVLYKAEPQNTLSQKCIDALRAGEINAVTFFSKRTAHAFMSAVNKSALSPALKDIKALCISASVVECVQSAAWRSTYGAKTPDLDGMVDLIQQHCVS